MHDYSSLLEGFLVCKTILSLQLIRHQNKLRLEMTYHPLGLVAVTQNDRYGPILVEIKMLGQIRVLCYI